MNVIFRLLVGFVIGAILFGCASHRPIDTAPTYSHQALHSEPYAATLVDTSRTHPRDTSEASPSVTAQKSTQSAQNPGPQRGFLGRIFSRRTPETGFSPRPQPTQNATHSPRKCKGCTFNIVAGDQTNNTAAKKAAAGENANSTQKPAAPVANQGGTSQDYTKQGQRGGAAASGAGSAATAATTKPGFWQAAIPALGVLGGIGGIYWLVLGGGSVKLLGLFKRRRQDDSTAVNN